MSNVDADVFYSDLIDSNIVSNAQYKGRHSEIKDNKK